MEVSTYEVFTFCFEKKANEAGYSFQEGYQRYNRKGWGYVPATDGDRVVGYQIFDYQSGFLVYPSYNDIHDHALELEEAVTLLKELCAARGVTF